jgi:CheY-like chemotaxis protein
MGLLASAQIITGRILVVDDDQGARDLIVSSLRADGHEVDASGNGFEALRLLGRKCYDLIVSDLMMPEADGPSLYSAVTLRWPSNPPHFLFVSGLANTSAFDGFLKVIHAPLLPKPFKIAALRRAIKRILQA